MAHAMEEIQVKFMHMLRDMAFHNKLVKRILLKTLTTLPALIFRDAKIAPHQQEQNQVIKETVGLKINTQYGKLLNMERFQELIK